MFEVNGFKGVVFGGGFQWFALALLIVLVSVPAFSLLYFLYRTNVFPHSGTMCEGVSPTLAPACAVRPPACEARAEQHADRPYATLPRRTFGSAGEPSPLKWCVSFVRIVITNIAHSLHFFQDLLSRTHHPLDLLITHGSIQRQCNLAR